MLVCLKILGLKLFVSEKVDGLCILASFVLLEKGKMRLENTASSD